MKQWSETLTLSCRRQKKTKKHHRFIMARTAADLNLSVLKRLDGDIQEVRTLLSSAERD